ncbi:MAG: hypothetical protein U0Q19_22350 [Kineosporiaceae bacterium]
MLLLPVLSLVLLMWPLACLVRVGPNLGDLPASALIAIAGAAPLATVLAVPLISVAARRGNWLALPAAAVAAVMPWVFVAPYAAGEQPTGIARTVELRVMLVNAHQGGASAPDIVAAATAGTVDVLVVTELSGALAHDLAVGGLDRVASAGWVRLPGEQGTVDDPRAGMGLWTRAGLTLNNPREVSGTQWPAMTIGVTKASASFTLIAGHVTTPAPRGGRRWADDLTLLRQATERAEGPRVLLANLNATSWHADFRRFDEAGIQDVADVLGQGPRPTWPTWSPLAVLPLDHAMVTGGVGVTSVETVVIGGSDHRALMATLTLPAPG